MLWLRFKAGILRYFMSKYLSVPGNKLSIKNQKSIDILLYCGTDMKRCRNFYISFPKPYVLFFLRTKRENQAFLSLLYLSYSSLVPLNLWVQCFPFLLKVCLSTAFCSPRAQVKCKHKLPLICLPKAPCLEIVLLLHTGKGGSQADIEKIAEPLFAYNQPKLVSTFLFGVKGSCMLHAFLGIDVCLEK